MSNTHEQNTAEVDLDLDEETLNKLTEIARIRETTIDAVVEEAIRAMLAKISIDGFEESLSAHVPVYEALCP